MCLRFSVMELHGSRGGEGGRVKAELLTLRDDRPRPLQIIQLCVNNERKQDKDLKEERRLRESEQRGSGTASQRERRSGHSGRPLPCLSTPSWKYFGFVAAERGSLDDWSEARQNMGRVRGGVGGEDDLIDLKRTCS
ncbi:hypothetical protein FQA47_015901 [Oryzias melastigma]|uniref:Uncharacterized protein n=1 Tax=Oryzias melastigma TaxID=30732 RepID=A0A834BYY9_ORYME|nr:hypothetical protein FQA47_015901 [Oryzias melastigma]